MKLEPESRKQLLRIAGGTAICTAAMWVLFAALHLVGWVRFDYTVVLASLVGAAVAIGNFAGICFVVQKIIDEPDEKKRKATLQLSYNSRMLLQAVWVVVAIAAWLACHLFAGRAAFLIVGAMIATTMSANVFFWIIPGQRKVVAAMTSGQPYDADALAIHGRRGKQRSVHNTYFTLPVLIAMLSNHYGFLTSHPRRWLVLCLLMAAGALIRQFFVQRHGWHHGRARHPWPFAAAGVLVLLGLIAWMKPAPVPASAALPASVGYAQIAPVLAERCVSCHGEAVQMKNLRLDSQAQVEQHAQLIYQQVVVSRIMPLSNGTHMTDAERALVARWFEGRGRAP